MAVFTPVPASGLRAVITARTVVNFIVFAALIFYFFCVHLNIQIRHTKQLPSAAPGGSILSSRYGFNWWVYASHVFRIIPYSTVIWTLGDFRNDFGLFIDFILHIIGIILEIIVLVVYGFFWNDCNDPGQPENPCNDINWCSFHFAAHPNFCANTAPFAPAPGPLGVNIDFYLLFFSAVAFAGLWLLHLILNRIYASYSTDVRARETVLGFLKDGTQVQTRRSFVESCLKEFNDERTPSLEEAESNLLINKPANVHSAHKMDSEWDNSDLLDENEYQPSNQEKLKPIGKPMNLRNAFVTLMTSKKPTNNRKRNI